MFNDYRFGFFGVGAGDDESVPDLLTGVVSLGVVVSSAVVVSSGVPNVDVWAPPELLTTTDGPESLTVDEDSDDEDSDADTDVVADADVLGDEEDEESADADVLGDEESTDAESDADDGSFDSDEVDLEEADDDESSAHATPGVVARAPPMPNATASAPTRPMYLA